MHIGIITSTKVGSEKSMKLSHSDGTLRSTKRDMGSRVLSGILMMTKPSTRIRDVVMKATNPVPKTMPKGMGQIPYPGKMF